MRWFINNLTRTQEAQSEEEGYNHGWLGLDYLNPYPVGTPQYIRYDRGYRDGELDADELVSYPTIEGNYDFYE